jgi:hypothetical protein
VSRKSAACTRPKWSASALTCSYLHLYDGHMLARVIPGMEEPHRQYARTCMTEAGYRGRNPAQSPLQSLRRWTEAWRHSRDQTRDASPGRNRTGYWPLKNERRLGRNYVHHCSGMQTTQRSQQ